MDELSRRQLVTTAIQNMAKLYKSKESNNQVANLTRLGGRLPDNAIDETDMNATLNGLDRIKLKGLMGSLVL